MKRIKELRVKNFKAFQDEQPFKINGKNVLVYGNNGSGKSSLFWALYTLLQSSTKEDVGVQKYFKKYVDSDFSTHQSLKNVFIDENEDSYPKLTVIDTETGREDISEPRGVWQVAQSHASIQKLPEKLATPMKGKLKSAANLKTNNLW